MKNGFGLLEVLAALTLLALGMLSLINGLLRSEQHSFEGILLAQADVHATNIYERMQANLVGVRQDAYYHPPGIEPNCNPCDPVLHAAKDLGEWQQQLHEQLVDAEGEVRVNQEIYLRWQSMMSDVENNTWVLYGE
jgi:prepilin-type N-terminal cleavage/methylation domain-containing protein